MNVNIKHISRKLNDFHGELLPESVFLVGYTALIEHFGLPVPIPDIVSFISEKHKKYSIDNWKIYTIRHKPDESIMGHLTFALKYEGINLLFFKHFFREISQSSLLEILSNEPYSIYKRKVWFLYEWLTGEQLDLEDLVHSNYVALVDEKVQYTIANGEKSLRHRIINNLAGTNKFCATIRKTEKIEHYIKSDFKSQVSQLLETTKKDVILRASAFLMLKDSKASFDIEGEVPEHNRALRWGKAISEAGKNELSIDELLRLQKIVIGDERFLNLGLRKTGGFIGEHDRYTAYPIPEHISAKWEDLSLLMNGLLDTTKILENEQFHPVFIATLVAFGFVNIHPFEDGNGRIHRFLLHHILAKSGFVKSGLVFPISSSLLEKIDDYRKVLQHYSEPLLRFISWKPTERNNVDVLNDTIDYYRYFDATHQVEFIFDSIKYVIDNILPKEIAYLNRYDAMSNWLNDNFSIPNNKLDLLIKFLEQGNGKLSNRALTKEFAGITDDEISRIEKQWLVISC